MNLLVNIHANLAPFMASMTQMRAQVQQLGQQMGAQVAIPAGATQGLQNMGTSLAVAGAAAAGLAVSLGLVAKASVDAFARQETAFAGIRKTVNATEQEFADLHGRLTAMSNRQPVGFSDLAKIGELAGQLGVRGVQNIEKFTDTISRIAVSTNLSTEAAAIGFARLAAVMQEPIENVDKMGSTLVALGNNLQTTESEILTFAQRVAGAGKIAGLTSAEVLSISAAFSSVGIQAEAGGTAVQKMLIEMTRAASVGGDKLRILAMIAGETEEGFRELFKTAPALAFTRVIEGVGKAGDSAFAALEGIVGEEARFLRAMLSMGNAGDLFARALQIGNKAAIEGQAHIRESNERFKTFTNTLATASNAVENLAASFGATLVPILRPMVEGFTQLVILFQQIPTPIKALATAFLVGTAAIVAMTAAVAGLSLAWGVLTGVGLPFLLLGAKLVAAITAVGLVVYGLIKGIELLSKAFTVAGGDLSRFTQGFVDMWAGLKAYAGDVMAWFGETWRDLWAGMGALFSDWAGAFYGTWTAFWTSIKDFVAGVWESLPGIVKTVLQGLTYAVSITAETFALPFTALAERGRQARAESVMQLREGNNELLREQARAVSMQRQLAVGRRGTGFNLIGETDFKSGLGAAQQQLQEYVSAQAVASAAVRVAVAQELMDERDALEFSRAALAAKSKAEDDYFTRAMGLAQRLSKGSEEEIQKLEKAHGRALLDRALAEHKYYEDVAKLDLRDQQRARTALFERVDAAQDLALALTEVHRRVNDEIADLGRTEFQQFKHQQQERVLAAGLAEETRLRIMGASEDKIQAMWASTYRGLDAILTKHLEEQVKKGELEIRALGASFGLVGIEAARASQAILLHGKAYDQLTEAEKREVEVSAQSVERMRQQRDARELLTRAVELETAGLEKNLALRTAAITLSMEREQRNLDTQIRTLGTLNTHYQEMEKRHAQLYMAQAQHEGNFYRFSVGALRRYAAEQDTIWQGLERALMNTFGHIQRTLSDVFFNAFTGQSMKIKDVFKDLLNAILRELATFMASATVKAFLGFLGNLMSGQSAGDATSNALRSLLPTTSGQGGVSGGAGTGTAVTGITGIVDLGARALTSFFGGSSATGTIPTVGTSFGSSGSIGFGGGMGTGTSGFISSSSFSDNSFSDFGYDYSVSAYSQGGRVGGRGRGDIVPAMLEPGEFVVRRDVAMANAPMLDRLNRGGSPSSRGGYLTFATGGMVPTIEARSITQETLLAAILQVLHRQTSATQQVAQNTGQTAENTGQAAAQASASSTPTWIAAAGGGGPQPQNLQLLESLGLASGGLRTTGGLASGAGYPTIGRTAVGLAGIVSLIQGLEAGNPFLAASGGLTASSALTMLLSDPAIAQSLGLSPNFAAGSGLVGQGLSGATGILGVIQALQQDNPLGAAAGGVQTLASIANILASRQAASTLGLGASTSTGFGIAGSALGVLGGGLNLYQGIQSGNVGQAAMGAYSTVAGTYGALSTLAPGTFPAVSTVAADALIAVAPELAASLGITGTAGAATAGGAYLGGTAAVSAGVTAGTAATGVGVVFAAILLLDQLGVFDQWGQHKTSPGERQTKLSAAIANQGVAGLTRYLSQTNDLRGLIEILNTQWGPHGEVQIGSSAFFGGLGDYDDPISKNYSLALGALYTPEVVNAGTGLQWAEEFIRELSISHGATGMATVPDPALVWQLQSKLAAALPNLPAYMGIKAAVSPGGDLFQAEQQRTTIDTAWMKALAIPAYATPGVMNTYDPYTGIGQTPDGRVFELHRSVIADYGINPYYYDPYAAVYGQLPSSMLSSMGSFGGDTAGISSDATGVGETDAPDAGGGVSGAFQRGGLVTPRHMRHLFGRDSVRAVLEPGEFVIPRHITALHADRLRGLVRTGKWSGDDRIMLPPTAAPAAQAATADRGLGSGGPMVINVTINGDVTDPRAVSERLGQTMRDVLRRQDSRYSRAGSKAQG